MRNRIVSSRWQGILNGVGFCARGNRGGGKPQRRRRFFEHLEDRTLLSVCHWSGGGENNLWSNPQNWDNAPQAGDELVFQGTGTATQNDLTENITLKSIALSSGGFSLAGHDIWLSDGVSVAGGASNISLNVALGGPVTVTAADGNSSLALSGAVSGGGSLTKAGVGSLCLSGANTYTGGTTIAEGTLSLGSNGALGANGNSLHVNGSDAALDLGGYSPSVGEVTLSDGSIVNSGGTAALSGTDYTVMKGTIAAALAGSGPLVKITNDAVLLSGANTYTGLTTVLAGTLELGLNAFSPVLSGGGADVQGGFLQLDYAGGASPAATVRSMLAASYATAFATGQIHCSTANPYRVILGWGDDTASQRVNIALALSGDANLDGIVNGADLNTVLAHYNKGGLNWAQGDFGYDGWVNGGDLNIVLSHYNQSLARPTLTVDAQVRSIKARCTR